MPVTCPHCSREFKGGKLNARHIAKCNPTTRPEVPPCLCGHESTSLTQMKRHRRECEVWQNRDRKAVLLERQRVTSLDRYGVEDARRSPEANAKRASTNLERYGAENPFCREATTFEKVQESLEGKRVQPEVNSFTLPEVQEKIRAVMVERYGAKNPQQVPDIRAKTRATSLERYGGEMLASPEIRAKAEATNLERYGVAFPGGAPAVQVKVIETNMARYGVPHTCMDPDVRRRQLETMEEHYGGHFFASEEGKAVVRAALMENHGVEFPGAIEGHWKKVVATFQERLGVDHPLQLEEFREKQRATNIERYGTPFPGLRRSGPNGLESTLLGLAPSGTLRFTGDGSWWRWLPKLGHHKNPDFVVVGSDPVKVVEAFGDFWHSRMFTGRAPFEHEQELIDAYADIGIECLVVWESEVRVNPEGVRGRLVAFLG